MYSLLSGLFKYARRKEEYAVLLLGLDNAGKTTLLESLKATFSGIQPRPPHQIAPTVGLNIGRVTIADTRISFWDLGGQLELHGIWEKYYDECHGIAFVVDSTDVDRIETALAVFVRMLRHQALRSVPLLVLVNKQDAENAVALERVVDKFIGATTALGDRDCRVQPLVALQGQGVREGVMWLIRSMQRNAGQRPPKLET